MGLPVLVVIKLVLLWEVVEDLSNGASRRLYKVDYVSHRISLAMLGQMLHLKDFVAVEVEVIYVQLREQVCCILIED